MNASKYLEEGLGIKIDETIADMINDEVSFVEFKGKHIALLQGMKSTNLYFIIRGIVRGYYIDEQGNDITKCFSSENEFFSSEGLRTASVSSLTNFFAQEGTKTPRAVMTSEDVARYTYKQLMKNKEIIIPGFINKIKIRFPVKLKIRAVAKMKN